MLCHAVVIVGREPSRDCHGLYFEGSAPCSTQPAGGRSQQGSGPAGHGYCSASSSRSRWRASAANLKPSPAAANYQTKRGFVGQPEDMLVTSLCLVTGTSITLGRVNIVNGGKLVFVEPAVFRRTPTGQDFWASAIIIENGGEMLAGVDYTKLDTMTKREEMVETEAVRDQCKDPTDPPLRRGSRDEHDGRAVRLPVRNHALGQVHGLRDPPKNDEEPCGKPTEAQT